MAPSFSRMVWNCKNTAILLVSRLLKSIEPNLLESHQLQSVIKTGDKVQFD